MKKVDNKSISINDVPLYLKREWNIIERAQMSEILKTYKANRTYVSNAVFESTQEFVRGLGYTADECGYIIEDVSKKDAKTIEEFVSTLEKSTVLEFEYINDKFNELIYSLRQTKIDWFVEQGYIVMPYK